MADTAAPITPIEPARWRPWEFVFWTLAFGAFWMFPTRLLLLNEVAILALFALSLDLVLGYAGIVSLGHVAFFGLGAYTAGILAKFVIADPFVGLLAGAAMAGLLGFVSSFLLLRGSDLTRLMVTLGVAMMMLELANKMAWLTGGSDGLQGVVMKPVLGTFDFDLYGKTAYGYSLGVLFLCFLGARRLVHSPFGRSLLAIKTNLLRARAIGVPSTWRLVAVYTIAAAMAGIAGTLSLQTAQFASLDILAFHRSADVLLVLIIGGAGYLYGGLIGALGFKVMQNWLSAITPKYWLFWLGLILVALVLVGRDRIAGGVPALWRRLRARP